MESWSFNKELSEGSYFTRCVSFVDKLILIAFSEVFLEKFLLITFITFSLILSKRLQHFMNDFCHFVVNKMMSDKKNTTAFTFLLNNINKKDSELLCNIRLCLFVFFPQRSTSCLSQSCMYNPTQGGALTVTGNTQTI